MNNLQNSEDPDQMPHYVVSDQDLHFCQYPIRGFQYKMGYSFLFFYLQA